MGKRLVRLSLSVVVAIGAAAYLAWVTSPDPTHNPASFEDTPVEVGIASLEEAITLAQYNDVGGAAITVLVTSYDGSVIRGINLSKHAPNKSEDPFEIVSAIGHTELVRLAQREQHRLTMPVDLLLPAGPNGDRHIGVGTNFPEHAEEASSDSVFMFPKFGAATPARTTVPSIPDGLLDYEVEICMRFDRPIATLQDFDAATKGLFLCGDFTDRIALLELADIDNLDSGYGFSDAKSGLGYFPTGPFLVIPSEWQSFVADVRMTTELNGEPRQDARGGEMTLDFRSLAARVLSEATAERFWYQDRFFKLVPHGRIEADMTLMSGTSEGVILSDPTRRDYIEMLLAYLAAGGPMSGQGLLEIGLPVFIDNNVASGHFLQPGDTVVHRSSALGDIKVDVIASAPLR